MLRIRTLCFTKLQMQPSKFRLPAQHSRYIVLPIPPHFSCPIYRNSPYKQQLPVFTAYSLICNDSRELSAQPLLSSQDCRWPSHCQVLWVITSPYGQQLSSICASWTHSFHKTLGFPPVWQAVTFQSYLLNLPLLSNLLDAAVFRAHSLQSLFSWCTRCTS